MIEKLYNYSTEDNKAVEKLIDDDPLMINHMVFPKGNGLPEHYSNSNVYMIVVRGILTLQLNEQEPHEYTKGKIINIPYHTRMNVNNYNDEIVEIFVLKSPSPRVYREE